MTQPTQDIRSETLALVKAQAGDAFDTAPQQVALIDTWLASLETEDLADVHAPSLASILWDGFAAASGSAAQGCQVVPLRYADGHGGWASALLVHNPDMPFLVDSIVMAMRRLQIASHAVLNAVLAVRRDADGGIVEVGRARTGGEGLESFVLCLLQEELSQSRQAALNAAVRMVAGDAAAVRRDSYAIHSALTAVAGLAGRRAVHGEGGDDARETAAFLEWAIEGGFEVFGYAFYRAIPGTRELTRDLTSRIGVLRDTSHPVYDRCLAGIPGEYDTLSARANTLSVVKADVESTLHRDQHLDFIGVRETNDAGVIIGEHCFIGLFSRAASLTPLAQLPFVRGRIAQVLLLAGVRKEGFRAEKFLEVLESLPRTEVFESDARFLANLCSTVVALYKQPRARVFARGDVYGRHLNLLVYLPRERYSEALSARLAASVRTLSGARDVRVETLLADGPLARLYLIASHARLNMALDVNIEQPLLASIEGWPRTFEALVDSGTAVAGRAHIRQLAASLPADYVARTSPHAAYRDLMAFELLEATPRIRVHVDVGTYGAVEIRLLSIDAPPSLSRILPALQNAGVAVDREQTFEIAGPEQVRFFATCLTVDGHSATRLAQAPVADAARELFELLLNDEAEDGRMNALVLEAGLRTREVQVIRAYASYWRQAGCRFSLRYIADCLKRAPDAVRTLVHGFSQRFDPAASDASRAAGTALLDAARNDLTALQHADTEDILRSLADLMLATLRTSYFQSKQIGDTILFKFDSSTLALLPQPRPYRELFVFSRRFEGVHLRGGPVARGGLRWSDRMEDYRTEVLGLVKAQMVKNAVIVPAGAKGGFVCKLLPKDATREVMAAEGEAGYRLFIAGLLDMTDNRLGGQIVAPQETFCYDPADPYLVVAADKGTATFSDIANGIAVARGFWLGDAFASGGSNGYDHKKLGITAKGAWEAVKRHFFELGHDLATTPISMTGVGDMSGDVFGNGLLLSHQVKLIAAFDHRHIFIDPTPDTARSFAERQRLFALPRSSWDDYDKALISAGGGVWPRSVRTIALSPQMQAALGTDVMTATPEELLHLILLAPVDLFYNGGIGTYIKASSESHAAVKDRANDTIRADGRELRCRVVAEGGNLGATQAGRIEFALAGGRIFTDAIDNSAGVDCSDHEVNVKIWLDTEVAAGSLTVDARNHALTAITGDIEDLVLRDNTLQTHLLAREDQAQADIASRSGYAALIGRLEAEQVISRRLEQLPDASELARRDAEGVGLTAPELAVVMAHVKNHYKRLLAALPLTGYEWSRSLLAPYFPAALVASRDPLDHPLANAILATVLANEAINRCGPLMIGALAARHAVDETAVLLAWARGWAALQLGRLFEVLDAHALRVTPAASRERDLHARALQAAVVAGVLSMPEPIDGEGASSATLANLAQLTHLFDDGQQFAPWRTSSSVPADDAFAVASQTVDGIESIADFLFSALAVDRPASMSLPTLLQVGVEVRRRTGIDALEQSLMHAAASPAQQALRGHALQVLRRAQQALLNRVLQEIAPVPAGDPETGRKLDARVALLPGAETSTVTADVDTAILRAWTLSEAILTTS
ncbi:MAG: NAD-glutamate dehydrogenase [Herminiimonas sp.]|nr:NAD-glutamate dehydrogenase [Herminiimonas sp.]